MARLILAQGHCQHAEQLPSTFLKTDITDRKMRKLIMWNIITLDGYFEGNQNWDLPFHNLVWGEELEQLSIEQLQSADYLVFGRVTYEGMAAHWTKAEGKIADLMNQIPKLVFSKTLKSAHWNNTTVIRENASAEIRKLKAKGAGDLYVFGSANLSETLINDNLFDEYRIGIAPVISGSGRPLFRKGIFFPIKLSLVSTMHLSTGGVVLKYTK
jgi:dihydrofolate reductase